MATMFSPNSIEILVWESHARVIVSAVYNGFLLILIERIGMRKKIQFFLSDTLIYIGISKELQA